ncbi:RNA polymerase subunit sigma [Clostridium sp. DSM 100503]|uniref:RNA polymerase subunit sigma n=1 Tax=Clostridium sp. DSM 100503 TaxID=2963282 RepID=UPI002149A021|nr:RNA polymerase subunit sigma [Clostridium sp. DSM 100503]MCR1952857.1 RNA polymerase subunit sigma [Clostridium sp. DSM 100503]
MSTNDEFRSVEYMLYNYKNTIAEIKKLKRDLEIIENDYRGVGSIGYEEKAGPTNAFSSSVENEVIKRAENIQRLKNKIRLKEIEIENINDAYDSLSENEQILIKERYFNNKSNKYVASILNVTEQTSCDYKNKLINKLIPLLIIN